MADTSSVPTCRWGIISTGHIASWFVSDLLHPRPDAKANHIIQCVGSRSLSSAEAFISKHFPSPAPSSASSPSTSSPTSPPPHKPTPYPSYNAVYNDPSVDIVYIGTPHAHHKTDCLAAIAAGKNVLCEKPLALNAREARDIFAAAEKAGVYVAEAMWLRHRPLVADLRRLLYPPLNKGTGEEEEERRGGVIGDVFRARCDFAFRVDVASLPESSRLRNTALGAGTWVDMGLYSLTWILLALEEGTPPKITGSSSSSSSSPGDEEEEQEEDDDESNSSDQQRPTIQAIQSFDPQTGVEVHTTALLHYPDTTGRHGIASSTYKTSRTLNLHGENAPIVFATIEGTAGYIEIEGMVPSHPTAFTVYPSGRRYEYESWPQGFVHEADNTALDIARGKKQSKVVPWGETVRVLGMMDEVRRQGGTVYGADLEE